MKIMLFMSRYAKHLGGGGEKIITWLANKLITCGYEVIILTNAIETIKSRYTLDTQVKVINIGGIEPDFGKRSKRLLRDIIRPVFSLLINRWREDPFIAAAYGRIRTEVSTVIQNEKPDIIMTYSRRDIFSLPADTPPVIAAWHGSDIKIHEAMKRREISYRVNNMAATQVLIPYFETAVKKYCPKVPVVWIPNPIPSVPENLCAIHSADKNRYRIVSVGNLSNGKNFQLLIKAFAAISAKFPEWNVEIYGTPLTQAYDRYLQSMIDEVGMKSRIFLMGRTDEVPKVLSESDIFAFPSLAEGFGIALGEAMTAKLPCVGLSSTTAVRYLLEGGCGILTDNNIEEYAQALELLMSDAQLRCRMGTCGREKIATYSEDRILNEFNRLFNSILTNN